MQAEPIPEKPKHHWLSLLIIFFVALVVAGLVLLALQLTLGQYVAVQPKQVPPAVVSTETPIFRTEIVVAGLHNPWETGSLPDGQLLVTEREGAVGVIRAGKVLQLAKIADVKAQGEGGLMGMAIDPDFISNHYIYTCFNSTKQDIRVVRWRLNAQVTKLEDRADILTGMPANPSGRHSGCRLAFGPDGYLWVGTGDSANASTPQDHKSLGGKLLRVDRDGKPASGNLGGDFDSRIYSYGHRNTQGLAFAPQPIAGTIGYSVEHGSSIDDEINPLIKGNFGWAPDPLYTEFNVPMTDRTKFPDAIDPIWRSGDPTQAPSGASFIMGNQWKSWNGSLAIAMLKAKHLKILQLDSNGKVAHETKTLTQYGRLRSVRQAADGSLYVTTDNANDDKIIRIVVE